MNFNREVNFVTRTDGAGLWSIQMKTVRINRVALAYVDEQNTFGELRAYFDMRDWDTDNDGLIYTDKAWMSSFRACMLTLGFSDSAIDRIHYSEAGMQGEDYVSMDVEQPFLTECSPLFRFSVIKEAVNN